MPPFPKLNKDAFKHISRCLAAFYVDNFTGTPVLPETLARMKQDLDEQESSREKLFELVVGGMVMLAQIFDKMEDALEQLEVLISKQIKQHHVIARSQPKFLMLTESEQKRIQRQQDMIVKQVSIEFADNREKLQNRIKARLDK